MPRPVLYAIVVLAALALVPLALIARARVIKSPSPRIHLVQDMDNQPKFRAQSENGLFADGRAMRAPVRGTVPQGQAGPDAASLSGRAGAEWITSIPALVTEQLLRRGQERFGIHCAPCHGLAGYGDGPVAKRAEQLQEETWTPPSSFHTDLVRGQPVGQVFNTISNGIRNMPAYGAQIPVADRWAIVAYVRALERSQNARPEDVPAEQRARLAR